MRATVIAIIMITMLVVGCSSNHPTAKIDGVKVVDKVTSQGYRTTQNWLVVEKNGEKIKIAVSKRAVDVIEIGTIVNITVDEDFELKSLELPNFSVKENK
jgi:hypothetical protein